MISRVCTAVVVRVTRIVSICLLISCADSPIEPAASARGNSSFVRDSLDFYFYQGVPIQLERDEQLVLVSRNSLGDPTATAAQVLAARGVSSVVVERTFPHEPGHVILRLDGAARGLGRQMVRDLANDRRFQFVSGVYRTVDGAHEFLPLNRIDVEFKRRTSAEAIDSLVRALGMSVIRPPRPDSGFFAYRLEYAPGSDPLEVSRLLDRHPLVSWASPDFITNIEHSADPTDPFFPAQFHLKNSEHFNGHPVDINVLPAWSVTTGASTTVAVIDDGIDLSHWNFGGGWGGDMTGTPVGMGYDLLWDPALPDDVFNPCCNDTHGTSIAGIIGAQHDNGFGGVGIAPNARLVAVRMFRRTYPPASFSGTQVASTAKIADGINWAWMSAGADVISNSWGGGAPSSAITNAISNAMSLGRNGKGTVVVFAAGNTSNRNGGVIGSVSYPATLSSSSAVISVGAINRFGAVTNYSPGSGPIDVVAPSGHLTGACLGEVITIDLHGSAGCNDGPQGNTHYTTTFSGTSASAPQVSAVAALLLSYAPHLTAAQVKSVIRSGANNWGSPSLFGAGKLNAYASLSLLLPPPPPPFTVGISGPSEVPTFSTCQYYANAQNGSAPFSYEWRYDGQLVGTDAFLYHSVSTHSAELTITVTDSQQRTAFQSAQIVVSPSGPPCFDM